MIIAATVGPVFAWCANNDIIHKFLRNSKWFSGVTGRTSFPSEWFSAFNEDKRWVLLHLNDGRRLFGWPYEWPDHCDSGHFVLMKPEWVLDDNQRAPLYNVERMLIAADDVRFVDILKTESETDESQADRQAVDELIKKYNAGQSEQEPTISIQSPGDSENGKQSSTTTARV